MKPLYPSLTALTLASCSAPDIIAPPEEPINNEDKNYIVFFSGKDPASRTIYPNFTPPREHPLDPREVETEKLVLASADTYAQSCFNGSQTDTWGNADGTPFGTDTFSESFAIAYAVLGFQYYGNENKQGIEHLAELQPEERYLLKLNVTKGKEDMAEELDLSVWQYAYGFREGTGSFTGRHVDKGQFTIDEETEEELGNYIGIDSASWAGPLGNDWAGSQGSRDLRDPELTTLGDALLTPSLTTLLDSTNFNTEECELLLDVTSSVLYSQQTGTDLTLILGLTNPREDTIKGMLVPPSLERGGKELPSHIIIE
tara:strand:- start:7051 stop:7992 length:942 start_codon:yes stop_codon:yes gene_type:complete